MEAAGIEPASENSSGGAATCVAYRLESRPPLAGRRPSLGQPQKESRRTRRGRANRPARLIDASRPASGEPIRRRAALFRQPEPSYRWQLILRPVFLRGARRPRHAAQPSSKPVEASSPPYSECPSAYKSSNWVGLSEGSLPQVRCGHAARATAFRPPCLAR